MFIFRRAKLKSTHGERMNDCITEVAKTNWYIEDLTFVVISYEIYENIS